MSSDAVRSIRRTVTVACVALLLTPALVFAQSPWERAAANLEAAFTGTLARSLIVY